MRRMHATAVYSFHSLCTACFHCTEVSFTLIVFFSFFAFFFFLFFVVVTESVAKQSDVLISTVNYIFYNLQLQTIYAKKCNEFISVNNNVTFF